MPPIDPSTPMGSYTGLSDDFFGQKPAEADPMSLLQMAQQAMGGGGGIASGGNGAGFNGPYDPNFSDQEQPGRGSHKSYGNAGIQPDDWSRYFDPSGEPRIFDAATAASQGGTSLAGLAGGFFPKYLTDKAQGYKIPSDQGGFFNVEDLFRRSPQGSVPQIGTFGSKGPSTNNWRLLGMGPGWIMRNGNLIDTQSSGGTWGGPAGFTPSGGNSGEQSMPPMGTALGTGAALGVPNLLQAGLGQPVSYGWPGADYWFGGSPMGSMQT